MLSKLRLTCRVIPSDQRRQTVRSAWTEDHLLPDCTTTPRAGPRSKPTAARVVKPESSTAFLPSSLSSLRSAASSPDSPSSTSLSPVVVLEGGGRCASARGVSRDRNVSDNISHNDDDDDRNEKLASRAQLASCQRSCPFVSQHEELSVPGSPFRQSAAAVVSADTPAPLSSLVAACTCFHRIDVHISVSEVTGSRLPASVDNHENLAAPVPSPEGRCCRPENPTLNPCKTTSKHRLGQASSSESDSSVLEDFLDSSGCSLLETDCARPSPFSKACVVFSAPPATSSSLDCTSSVSADSSSSSPDVAAFASAQRSSSDSVVLDSLTSSVSVDLFSSSSAESSATGRQCRRCCVYCPPTRSVWSKTTTTLSYSLFTTRRGNVSSKLVCSEVSQPGVRRAPKARAARVVNSARERAGSAIVFLRLSSVVEDGVPSRGGLREVSAPDPAVGCRRRSSPPSLSSLSTTPRGDSDTEAQLDSQASSDLDHCEELQAFELAENFEAFRIFALRSEAGQVPPTQMPGRLARDDPHQRPPDPDLPPGSQLPPPLEMSVQECEQLPPLSPEPEEELDSDAELPTMWEDGGGLGVIGGGGFSVGERRRKSAGDGEEDGRTVAPGQWAIVTEEAVRIFSEDVVVSDHAGSGEGFGSSADHDDDDDDDGLSFEQRNNLIEQTLSEIYQSPFQQLNYAVAPSSGTGPQHPAQGSAPRRQRRKKTTRFDVPDSEPSENRPGKNRTADNNNGGGDCCDDEEEPANCNGNNHSDEEGDEDEWSESESSLAGGAAPPPAAAVGRAEAEASGGGSDADSSMKASIARAARLAVSGYRTCDDADSYVGTRVKPTLILARAPPSPCGILRRSNKKAAVKVGHGNVRWADGRVSTLSSPEDVIPE